MTDVEPACVFCEIVAGTAPASVVQRWDDACAFTPLDPVVAGHTLIVPREHVSDATESPRVTAQVMYRAALYASGFDHSNIIASTGKPATQSIFHLHIHVIPRAAGDQLMVPWGTTGNPHDPHWCKVAAALQAKLDAALLVQPGSMGRPLGPIGDLVVEKLEPALYRVNGRYLIKRVTPYRWFVLDGARGEHDPRIGTGRTRADALGWLQKHLAEEAPDEP